MRCQYLRLYFHDFQLNVIQFIFQGQLFLAFQVKADKNSVALEGLKKARQAIKNATDELVKVATDSLKTDSPMVIQSDVFKEVFLSNSIKVELKLKTAEN